MDAAAGDDASPLPLSAASSSLRALMLVDGDRRKRRAGGEGGRRELREEGGELVGPADGRGAATCVGRQEGGRGAAVPEGRRPAGGRERSGGARNRWEGAARGGRWERIGGARPARVFRCATHVSPSELKIPRPRSLRRHRSSPNPRPPAQPRFASPVALVRLGGAPPRVGRHQHRRRNRRGARPPCPAAATGGAWRRPAAGPDGAVVQAGGRAARGNTLRPRRTSNFGGLDLLMEFSFRARTGRPPTSSPANRDI
uniref:Uncharacterized protein n=1 Tax=Oryza rufipogon TaxID=4529 RepID=A0A0E0P9V1_ORYRU